MIVKLRTSLLLFCIAFTVLFFINFSVETDRIQKESAAVDAKLKEHSRACSELKRLQVQ